MGLNDFRLLVGGGPTATYFFCFAKKSKQKKATPTKAETPEDLAKNGEEKNSASPQTVFLPDPFLAKSSGCFQWGIQKQPQPQLQKQPQLQNRQF